MTSTDCSEGSPSVPSLTTSSCTSSLSLLLSPAIALERAPAWQIYFPAQKSHSSGRERPPELFRVSEQANWLPLEWWQPQLPHSHGDLGSCVDSIDNKVHFPSSIPESAAFKSLVCASVSPSANDSGLHDLSAVELLHPRVHIYRFN